MKNQNYLGLLIVVIHEIKIIEGGYVFMLGIGLFHGHPRSNQLSLCQLLKLNLLLQQLVLVKLFGRGKFLKSYISSK